MVIADGQGTGTIINDDIGGNVQFGGVAYNVNENQAAAVVTVTRENGNASDIVVQYSSSNGSATANQDYLPVNGSVTFGANETVKTFTVPIINDSLDEEPIENVHLTLTGVAGGATLGAPSNAVLNIEDDDPPPQLRLNNLSLNEGSSGQMSFASVTVNLLAASGRSVSVNFSTENGTAAAPADYQAVSGTLTFSPGETSKTLSVGIVGDRDIEPDEFFRILLASPVNATIENGIGTVTILNDDFRRAAHDFDGDGRADISVYRPSDGTWYLLRSSGGFAAQQFGISTDKPVPADYDGDGRTDIAVFRGGVWYLLRSSAGFTGVQFGTSEDIPQPADFDGDGRAELAVFRPSTGTWYMLNLATNQFSGIQFGAGGDKPVAADYDGDGRADQAVFRPSDGTWYLLRSTQGFTGVQFGISTDRPVPADYDADGKVDQAVYRDGIWYILGSSQGFTGIQFGIASDIPAPADFDGDGKADPAVFRNGNWYLLQTTDGFNGVQFGTNGDAPLSPAFIP